MQSMPRKAVVHKDMWLIPLIPLEHTMLISDIELQIEEQSLILGIAQRTEQFSSYIGMEELFAYAQCVDAINLTFAQTYLHLRSAGGGVSEEQLTALDQLKLQMLDKLS